MNFKVVENGKEIQCNIVLSFRDDNNDINYVVYTDGSLDENNELELHASRYILNGEQIILMEIENEYEWDLIDNMLQSKYNELEK